MKEDPDEHKDKRDVVKCGPCAEALPIEPKMIVIRWLKILMTNQPPAGFAFAATPSRNVLSFYVIIIIGWLEVGMYLI
jgi:hypothetical protein